MGRWPWLSIALVSEGASDDSFLAPLRLRSISEFCPLNAWDDRRLGLPVRRRDLESLPDPKRSLRDLFESGGRWDPEYLGRLGRSVSLACLRELPAFLRWENDLTEALRALPGFTNR